MRNEPIIVHDRYTGKDFEEDVYGGAWLRRVYGNPLGRLSLGLISRAWFSRWYGRRMSTPASSKHIRPFMRDYAIGADEFAEAPETFASFNDFFTRRLKPQARPICDAAGAVVFPADGRHLAFPCMGEETAVFAKGQRWDMQRLLAGNEDLLQHLAGGTMVLSRLCPVDYHHFHYPLGGDAGTVEWVDGRLYSVSPIALRQRLAYFWENKRTITRVKHPAGTYVFMEIGATNVGSIHHVASGHGGPVATGARKGWFAFGGSSVLSWFPAGMVQLDADLLSCSARGVELYARVNDRMGCLSAG